MCIPVDTLWLVYLVTVQKQNSFTVSNPKHRFKNSKSSYLSVVWRRTHLCHNCLCPLCSCFVGEWFSGAQVLFVSIIWPAVWRPWPWWPWGGRSGFVLVAVVTNYDVRVSLRVHAVDLSSGSGNWIGMEFRNLDRLFGDYLFYYPFFSGPREA